MFAICLSIIVLLYIINIIVYFNHIAFLRRIGELETVNLISYYSTWKYLISNLYGQLIQLLAPVLIIIPALYPFFEEYHTGFFHEILMRKKYNVYIKENIFNSWLKMGFWLSLISIIIFIGTYFVFPNSVVTTNNTDILYYSGIIQKYPFWGFVIGTINMTLFSIIAINLGIVMMRFIKNFSLLILASFILFISVGILLETIIGDLAVYISGIRNLSNCFSLFNSWVLEATPYLWINTLCLSVLVIISTITIFVIYKNKEKVILNYE